MTQFSKSERELELEKLIAEQRKDMQQGDRVSRPNQVPLEAASEDWGQNKKHSKLKQPISSEDSRHGSTAGHRAGCKCDLCRRAEAKYRKAMRQFYRERGLPPDDPRHGTFNAYSNLACRCSKCKAANSKNQREYQAKRKKKDG